MVLVVDPISGFSPPNRHQNVLGAIEVIDSATVAAIDCKL